MARPLPRPLPGEPSPAKRHRWRRAPWDLLITAVVGASWPLPPSRSLPVDHAIYLSTVHFMRRGVGYYAAMDHALRTLIGPAATPRAFRLPTVFLVWRLLPNDTAIWWLFVTMVVVGSVSLARICRASWAGPLIAVWFLYNGWDKYTLVEMWGSLIVIAAITAWANDCPRISAALGTLAGLVRETTVPILMGGFVSAHRHKRARLPWLAGLVICAGAFALSAHLAAQFLVPHGTESPLMGTGRPPWSIARWLGFGLPGGPILGPILWVVAVGTVLGELPGLPSSDLPTGRRWPPLPGFDDLLLPTLLFPVLGLLVTRDYFGALVVPFTIALSAGGITRVVAARLSSRSGKALPA